MKTLTRSITRAEVRDINRTQHTVDAVLSTAAVDDYGSIFLPSGWRLERYRQNPILLWGHSRRGGPEMVIGRALKIGVVGDQLEARFEYAVDRNPVARQVFDLVEGGYLRAFSHGSQVAGTVYPDSPLEVLEALPEAVRQALRGGMAWEVYTETHLLEASQVFIGGNRDALARAVREGVVDEAFAAEVVRGLAHQEPAEMVHQALRAASQVEASVARLEALVERAGGVVVVRSPEPTAPAEEAEEASAPAEAVEPSLATEPPTEEASPAPEPAEPPAGEPAADVPEEAPSVEDPAPAPAPGEEPAQAAETPDPAPAAGACAEEPLALALDLDPDTVRAVIADLLRDCRR